MRDQKQPMGFNTWNTFGTDIDEKTVRELACALTDKVIPICALMTAGRKNSGILRRGVSYPIGTNFLPE